MSKEKRKNPYQNLLDEIIQFCASIKYRHRVFMWRYQKEKLAGNWRLDELSERVKAADQLGYEVVLDHNDGGDLCVWYRKKVSIPFHWQS